MAVVKKRTELNGSGRDTAFPATNKIAIVSEMGYASGTHRQVLFTIGLVLFIFIMVINLVLTYVLKRGDLDE